MGVFNKTIIPLVLVGYEMIIANSALRTSLPSTISYPTRTRGIIVNYMTVHLQQLKGMQRFILGI